MDDRRGRGYQPLTLQKLAGLFVGADGSRRWRLVAEFLEEYRWESADSRLALLQSEPHGTGDDRWDVFLARVDALVHAPAAFRRRGVYVAPQELGVA